jgi:uncharacterized protein YuzE
LTLSYDNAADVLYVTFERLPVGSYLYVENENGDVLRVDKNTQHIVGCTIPFFAKRAALGPVIIPEVGEVPFNDLAKNLVSL